MNFAYHAPCVLPFDVGFPVLFNPSILLDHVVHGLDHPTVLITCRRESTLRLQRSHIYSFFILPSFSNVLWRKALKAETQELSFVPSQCRNTFSRAPVTFMFSSLWRCPLSVKRPEQNLCDLVRRRQSIDATWKSPELQQDMQTTPSNSFMQSCLEKQLTLQPFGVCKLAESAEWPCFSFPAALLCPSRPWTWIGRLTKIHMGQWRLEFGKNSPWKSIRWRQRLSFTNLLHPTLQRTKAYSDWKTVTAQAHQVSGDPAL